jgi:hypothetical protein
MAMMTRWVALLVLLAVQFPAAANGDSPDIVDSNSDRVAELVNDLAHSSRATREAARESLLNMGPEILGSLPAAEVLTDAAGREAVRQIRTQLETRLVAEHIQATRVTHEGEASVRELLRVAELQTGNSLVIDDTVPAAHLDRILTVHWEAEEYWSAIMQLADELDATLERMPNGTGLRLVLEHDGPQPHGFAVAGPFLIVLQQVTTKEITQQGASQQLLRLDCEVIAEPRLRPLFADVPTGVFVVTLGEQTLPPFNSGAVQTFDFGSGGTMSFRHDCVAPIALVPADDLALRMSGRLHVDVAAVPEQIRFLDLQGTRPVSRRRGEATITLTDIQEFDLPTTDGGVSQRVADVQILTQYDAGGPVFESYRLSALFRDVRLELPSGETRAADDDLVLTREQNGAVAARYRFQNLPADWKQGTLVYVAPLATPRVEVPITLETTLRDTTANTKSAE